MKFPRKVYCIRHNVTNRVYIGSSCHVDARLSAHMSALRNHGHLVEDMQKDFDRYGEDFMFAVLDEIGSPEEKEKEYQWMDKYRSYIRGVGYNYKDTHVQAKIKTYHLFDEEDGRSGLLRPIRVSDEQIGEIYDHSIQTRWCPVCRTGLAMIEISPYGRLRVKCQNCSHSTSAYPSHMIAFTEKSMGTFIVEESLARAIHMAVDEWNKKI
ncbi:MAG: GIY-YIG nuclease family protein [Clostridia bacterium]|nr:GIY-YIG nuclease family protein [Clostridia bacterium]MBQ8836465.1 GIY-YIG nuclease family protein [Clostridia bacterium]